MNCNNNNRRDILFFKVIRLLTNTVFSIAFVACQHKSVWKLAWAPYVVVSGVDWQQHRKRQIPVIQSIVIHGINSNFSCSLLCNAALLMLQYTFSRMCLPVDNMILSLADWWKYHCKAVASTTTTTYEIITSIQIIASKLISTYIKLCVFFVFCCSFAFWAQSISGFANEFNFFQQVRGP